MDCPTRAAGCALAAAPQEPARVELAECVGSAAGQTDQAETVIERTKPAVGGQQGPGSPDALGRLVHLAGGDVREGRIA